MYNYFLINLNLFRPEIWENSIISDKKINKFLWIIKISYWGTSLLISYDFNFNSELGFLIKIDSFFIIIFV